VHDAVSSYEDWVEPNAGRMPAGFQRIRVHDDQAESRYIYVAPDGSTHPNRRHAWQYAKSSQGGVGQECALGEGLVDLIEAGVDRPPYGNLFWAGALQRKVWRESVSKAKDFSEGARYAAIAFSAAILKRRALAWSRGRATAEKKEPTATHNGLIPPAGESTHGLSFTSKRQECNDREGDTDESMEDDPAAEGDYKRVTIWNWREKRKLSGNSAPFKKNLQEYIRMHPDWEMYVGQDKLAGITRRNNGRTR